jgi:hypothetical protein
MKLAPHWVPSGWLSVSNASFSNVDLVTADPEKESSHPMLKLVPVSRNP